MAELEKESAEQQQHIQTLHNQLAEEKGKLEKKGDITGMEKQVETLTTELEESTTTQQALQEQIEKLTVQLQKVEAEKQALQEAVQQEVIVKQRMEELKNELQNSLQQKMKQK